MLSLKSIYETSELNGIPVTLLGVQNNVALFIDIDGNEIELAVDCDMETLGFELGSIELNEPSKGLEGIFNYTKRMW